MVDTLYPGVGLAAASLLRRSGADVVFPDGQTCCGQPALNAGYRNDARRVARHFVDIFHPPLDDGTIDAIVAPSGSCVAMVKHQYPRLFEDDDPYRRRAIEIGDVTYELTQYLADYLGFAPGDARYAGKITYHPCCHLLRELGIDAQPRQLLAKIQDAELVELPDAEECCGFGGVFAIKNAEISTAMGRRKAKNLAASGADVVALCDVSCMTHLNGIRARDGYSCRAVHVAELLAGSPESEPADQEPADEEYPDAG
jgi:L-lactate dehydrogenase complex protein LldE